MLIIRPEQLAALDEAVRMRFVRALCAEMRERFPSAAAMEPERLERFAREETAKAVASGIDSERGLTAFILAAWQLGTGFDRSLRGPGAALAADADPAERERRLIALVHRLGVFSTTSAESR